MINLASRNLKIFFRDRTAVFFSLFAAFIVIGLYVLFLGDMLAGNMPGIPNARFLMDSWIVAGLLAITSITTSMGAFGTMVDDRHRKISKDFYCSPIKRGTLAGGYILSSFVIGVIMTVVTLILGEAYIVSKGGHLLPAWAVVRIVGLILLSVLASSSMVFLAVSLLRSQSAFASASTVIGTLIGFLTGIYIPIGSLPKAVQLVIKVFPVSHAAALFRQVFMEIPMSEAFRNAPADQLVGFKEGLGVVFRFGDTTLTSQHSIIALLITAVTFYGLAIVSVSRKEK